MADKRISECTSLSAVASGDLIPVVDISDTADATSGTTKKITKDALFGVLGVFQSVTHSTALTGTVISLNSSAAVINATLAPPTPGQVVIIVNQNASGVEAHTVDVGAAVTVNGTDHVCVLNAAGEAIQLVGLTSVRWMVLTNVGAVSFTT